MNTIKKKIAMYMTKKGWAIDHTTIYYFQVAEPLRRGDILRWDSAENLVEKLPQEIMEDDLLTPTKE